MRSNSRCFGAWANNTSKIWPGHSQRNYLILRFGHVFTPNHLERWWVVPILYNIVYTMRPGVTLDHIDIHVHTQHLHGHPSQLMGIYCVRRGVLDTPNFVVPQTDQTCSNLKVWLEAEVKITKITKITKQAAWQVHFEAPKHRNGIKSAGPFSVLRRSSNLETDLWQSNYIKLPRKGGLLSFFWAYVPNICQTSNHVLWFFWFSWQELIQFQSRPLAYRASYSSSSPSANVFLWRTYLVAL